MKSWISGRSGETAADAENDTMRVSTAAARRALLSLKVKFGPKSGRAGAHGFGSSRDYAPLRRCARGGCVVLQPREPALGKPHEQHEDPDYRSDDPVIDLRRILECRLQLVREDGRRQRAG